MLRFASLFKTVLDLSSLCNMLGVLQPCNLSPANYKVIGYCSGYGLATCQKPSSMQTTESGMHGSVFTDNHRTSEDACA